jgi:hypothetical protein
MMQGASRFLISFVNQTSGGGSQAGNRVALAEACAVVGFSANTAIADSASMHLRYEGNISGSDKRACAHRRRAMIA